MRLLTIKPSRWKFGDLLFLLYCLFFMANIAFSNSLPEQTCPETCICSKSAGLVNCSNKNLKEIPKNIPTWVKQLSLRNNRLLTHGLLRYNFSRLSQLQELDFSENKLQNLTLDLSGTYYLRKISLNRCSLSTLPRIKLDSNITHLSLSFNSVTELGESLRNYTELIELDLSFNKIKQIKPNTFQHQQQLTHLYLQKNRINVLGWTSFLGLDSIELIDVSRNKIRNIAKSSLPKQISKQERCFGNLQSLKHLNLSQNQMTHIGGIGGLTFSGMCALETLTLDRNKINQLNDGAFYGPIALKTLTLDHNFLNAVSRGWLFELSSLQTLSAAYNNMSRIEPDGWDFCKKLIHLDLSHNRLPTISSHGFSKLGNLETLQLSYNRITVLADFAFDGLGQLTILDLSNNEISSSIEDINGAFLGLSSIQELSLRQNKIRALSASALEGLESIVTLDLCENDVTSVQNHTFDKMENLRKLSIISSSFLCDCQLAWFPSWLLESNRTLEDFVYRVEGTCFHPPALKGRDILSIETSEFICVDHPIPVLLQEPVARTALIGDNITLECSASATYTNDENETTSIPTSTITPGNPLTEAGSPPPIIKPRLGGLFPLKADEPEKLSEPKKTPPQRRDAGKKFDEKKNGMLVTWKRGHEIIHPGMGIEIRNITRQQGAYVYVTSVLVLNRVTADDNGKYNCIVSNNYGHARSTPVELTVNEYPKFSKMPVNVTIVKNGSTALLECGATGLPSPQITWQKDGGKSFPAATQRRLRREQKNLRQPPQIVGETAPTSSQKGGMFLKPASATETKTEENKNDKFTVDTDAPLEFGVVLMEDAGEYECVAQSSVGRIVAKALLIVEIEPSFTKPVPASSKAIVGGSAVLQCMVSANPKPDILWKFNGKNLEKSARHYMAAEDQILIVINATTSDGGVYSCFISNKHGDISGVTELDVSRRVSDNFLSKLFSENLAISIVIIVAVMIFCIIFTSIVCWIIMCIRKKEQDKALSTGTDTTTDLPPGLDANSYVSTDESIRKCHSSHDVNLTEDETNGSLPNRRYETSPYQGSASSPDISHMQITQCTTPGSLNTTPRYPIGNQLPRRCHSSLAIKEHRPLMSSFISTEGQNSLCNGSLHSGRTKVGGRNPKPKKPSQPIMSPSKSFARKAAGADDYEAVEIRSPKKGGTTEGTSAPDHNSKSKRLKKVKVRNQRTQEKEQTHKNNICNNVGNNTSVNDPDRGVCFSNRGKMDPSKYSEHTKQNGGLVKSRNHDSENTKSWRTRPYKDRRKGDSTSSGETIPLGDSVASSRKLRNSTDESQPKISSSSGPTEFSSNTTLTSESSQLLHHNTTPLHNCLSPPSGSENTRLLT